MGNQWGLGLHFIFATIFLVVTTKTCLGAQNTTVACFEHERLALLKFKHSVRDASNMLSSWVGNDCCHWDRVMCDDATGSVESLHLNGGYSFKDDEHLVSNEVSTSLGELRHLKYLDLSVNDFQGSRIPKFIGSLKELTYLSLSCSNFSGIIPHHIGNLSSLKKLDLSSYVYHQGLVADDMTWISGLLSLEHLVLSGANLSGANNLDMVFYMIPLLKKLSLSGCGLSNVNFSPLRNLSTSLCNIKLLDLRENSLKGQPPPFFQNMTSLQILDLSQNMLTGPIPKSLGKLRLLQVLDLSQNMLTGPIPKSLGKLRLLQVLDLSYNNLIGPIPTFPKKLTELDLYANFLNGSIPESIGRLASLKFLYLGQNELSGTIPVSIGQLSKLRSLDVTNNSLDGVVCESHFANLLMLVELNAAYNSKLTFNISREWLPPFQLTDIDLSSCKIENQFPQWLRNQRKLNLLMLSNATISGPLPLWLRKMPFIQFIDLSHNNLTGTLANLPVQGTYRGRYAQALLMQNNNLNGPIPKSLCKRTHLQYLNLSWNRLTGKIPNCLKKLQNLFVMMLSSNGLSGAIPSFIWNVSSLNSLQLSNNNFSGELPQEIGNLSKLSFLDLGDNAFSGRIPEWIGDNITSLEILRLHKNNFTGGIPRSLCKNVGIQVLDVAHNNLVGTIPHCLGEFQGMIINLYNYRAYLRFGIGEGLIQVLKGSPLEYTSTLMYVTNMDLSSNKLVGEIPVELTALSNLVGLNLSNNHLSGGIPDNIGDMKALNSLDLSGNELSGLIPPSIGALTFLSYLNLSNNNLSGRIPTGNQLQTLIDPSIYGGNRDLCGAPLPKNCSDHEETIATSKSKYRERDEPKKVWFYVDIMCGYAAGFWGVIVVLVLKKQWRHKLFMFAGETMDKIYVAVMIRVNKIKR